MGVDFTFFSFSHAYGIPEHADRLALRNTRCFLSFVTLCHPLESCNFCAHPVSLIACTIWTCSSTSWRARWRSMAAYPSFSRTRPRARRRCFGWTPQRLSCTSTALPPATATTATCTRGGWVRPACSTRSWCSAPGLTTSSDSTPRSPAPRSCHRYSSLRASLVYLLLMF